MFQRYFFLRQTCFSFLYRQSSLTFFFGGILLDHDECDGASHGCQQKCVNVHGSYSCACLNGYELNNDNKTCSGLIQKLFFHVFNIGPNHCKNVIIE